jgi:hypothetical protein
MGAARVDYEARTASIKPVDDRNIKIKKLTRGDPQKSGILEITH